MVLWYQIVIDVLMVGIIFNIYGCYVSVQNKFGWELENYFCPKKIEIYFYEKLYFDDK